MGPLVGSWLTACSRAMQCRWPILGRHPNGVKSCRRPPTLKRFHKAPEFFAPAWVTQFPESLGFDLPDTFACHFEILPHFFERVIRRFADSKPFPENFFLTGGQRLQGAVDLTL